ncbi:hypothetical protein SEA_FIRECASTLE_52 [Microbacterium phage FireCastle]
MPDQLMPPHPVMRQLYQMKPEGWEERQRLGGALASFCLFHGTHRAFVAFADSSVVIGSRVWTNVRIPTVVVVCDPSCGYEVRWTREDRLGGCKCSLDT